MTQKEKPEFCAGVKILIERMQTTPEDFADSDYDFANMRAIKQTKFGLLAKMLEQLVTGRDKAKLLEGWAEWHYLTEEEQTALLDAFKQMRRTEFDKRIMERVFDEEFYTRQEAEAEAEERGRARYLVRQSMANQHLQPGQIQPYTTTETGGGIMNAIGLGGLFK